MPIPIHNLYYLLLYAWDRLEEGRTVNVGGLEHGSAADLLARILVSGTRRVLRRGLDRGYVSYSEETARPRGRIEFAPTARRLLVSQGRVVCAVDELTPDVLTNRIVRTTLGRLAQVEGLDSRLRHDLRGVHRQMAGVREVPLSRSTFSRVRLHAGNAFYRLLLDTCALAHANLLPREAGEGYRFRDFTRDERQMATLFEAFLLGFYRREVPGVRAEAETMSWEAEPLTVSGHGRLPSMRTDVTLRGDGWTCVVDAKYYRAALSRWHADGTFSPDNLYQLLSYLHTLESRGGADSEADGALIYPVVDGAFDHTYRIRGHRVRLLTLDLRRPWPDIHTDLLALSDWSANRTSP